MSSEFLSPDVVAKIDQRTAELGPKLDTLVGQYRTHLPQYGTAGMMRQAFRKALVDNSIQGYLTRGRLEVRR